MNLFFATCVGVALAVGAPPAGESGSYLYQPASKVDRVKRPPTVPYVPQPGDMMFGAENKIFSVVGHWMALTSYPNHSAIAFRRHDGTMGMLEAAPHSELARGIALVDAYENIHSYAKDGRVWIRQRKVPLSDEESARLTEFAYAIEGRGFAKIRIAAQSTPLRAKTPIKAHFLGQYDPNKKKYFCSEAIVTAAIYAGLLDPSLVHPATLYPRDIFLGRSSNGFANRSLAQFDCGWHPPARWTECPDFCDDGQSSAPPVAPAKP